MFIAGRGLHGSPVNVKQAVIVAKTLAALMRKATMPHHSK